MDELISFLVQCFIWYIVFKIVFAIADVWIIKKHTDIEKEELKDKLIKLIHYVNQEKHGDCYYWFDKETDAFLAQGKTDEEIKNHLSSRFKGHVFVLDDKRALFGPDLKMVSLDQLPKLFNATSKTS